jgi:CRP-like cAMP-binding protein
MSQLTSLSEEEALAIEESFPIRTFEKGTFLLEEGQVATDVFFVVKGCIRNYQIVDGEEKTLDFYTENQTAAEFNSLANKVPTTKNFICIEETTVAIINSTKENELYLKHPRFETFCRTGMEQMMGNHQNYLSTILTLSPKERYLNLLNEKPDLIQRVPQYQLASYLGVEPETLSRIRKQLMVEY